MKDTVHTEVISFVYPKVYVPLGQWEWSTIDEKLPIKLSFGESMGIGFTPMYASYDEAKKYNPDLEILELSIATPLGLSTIKEEKRHD